MGLIIFIKYPKFLFLNIISMGERKIRKGRDYSTSRLFLISRFHRYPISAPTRRKNFERILINMRGERQAKGDSHAG